MTLIPIRHVKKSQQMGASLFIFRESVCQMFGDFPVGLDYYLRNSRTQKVYVTKYV